MSLGDRLALAGVILTFFGTAVPMLWIDKKWIGYVCLAAAFCTAILWGILEFRARDEKHVVPALPTQTIPSPKAEPKKPRMVPAPMPEATWNLTTEQQIDLIKSLTGTNGTAYITINKGDEKSRELSLELISVFQRAGWQVNDVPNMHDNLVPIQGLRLTSVYGGNAPVESTFKALKDIGFHPSKDFAQNPKPDTVYIFVGVKD